MSTEVIAETRECIACREKFEITESEADWMRSMGFVLPKRCPECRTAKKLGAAHDRRDRRETSLAREFDLASEQRERQERRG